MTTVAAVAKLAAMTTVAAVAKVAAMTMVAVVAMVVVSSRQRNRKTHSVVAVGVVV